MNAICGGNHKGIKTKADYKKHLKEINYDLLKCLDCMCGDLNEM